MDDNDTVTDEKAIDTSRAPQPINCGDPGPPGQFDLPLWKCSYMGEDYYTYVKDTENGTELGDLGCTAQKWHKWSWKVSFIPWPQRGIHTYI